MNAQQRKTIGELISKLEDIKNQISDMQSEEQDKFDNLSEGLQQSEQGQKTEEAANVLREAEQNLDDCIANLESVSE